MDSLLIRNESIRFANGKFKAFRVFQYIFFVFTMSSLLIIQTANSKQQTANSKQQTANSKQQTANSIIKILVGESPLNNLQLGTPYYHIADADYPNIMYRPYVGLTFHSVNITYVQSCHYYNAFALAIERKNYSIKITDRSKISLGYRAGVVYGAWCFLNNELTDRCGDHTRIIPTLEPFLSYENEKIGVSLGLFGNIALLNMIVYLPV